MRLLGSLRVAWFVMGLLGSVSARADEAESGMALVDPEGARAGHANIFALSLAYQAPLSLDKAAPFGGGLTYTREYFVAPRTALGIHTGLRIFPSPPLHLAFGYGLTFKHYVGHLGNAGPRSGLYVLYGLLLQLNWLEGRNGTATGHDTRMALGYDWRAGNVFPVVEAGYHLTQVRNFDEDTIWWPYAEVSAGIRF